MHQQAIRKREQGVDREKAAYGEKLDPMMMHDSKRDVADLICEEAGSRSIRERLVRSSRHSKGRTKEKQRQLGTIKFQRECILNDALPLFLLYAGLCCPLLQAELGP